MSIHKFKYKNRKEFYRFFISIGNSNKKNIYTDDVRIWYRKLEKDKMNDTQSYSTVINLFQVTIP